MVLGGAQNCGPSGLEVQFTCERGEIVDVTNGRRYANVVQIAAKKSSVAAQSRLFGDLRRGDCGCVAVQTKMNDMTALIGRRKKPPRQVLFDLNEGWRKREEGSLFPQVHSFVKLNKNAVRQGSKDVSRGKPSRPHRRL